MSRTSVLCFILTLGTVDASVVFKWGTSCYLEPNATEKRSFYWAREECRKRLWDLVVMETEQEHIALWELFGANKHPFWVGATVSNKNEEFTWLNNITIARNLWLPGKPDDQGKCIRWRLVNSTRGLANSHCNRSMRYICERKKRSANDSCSEKFLQSSTGVSHHSIATATQQEMTSTVRNAMIAFKCSCVCFKSAQNMSRKQFTEIHSHLRIAKNATGSAVRRSTSAVDHRISSLVIGCFAVLVLTVPVAVIVLLDISSIYPRCSIIYIKKSNIISIK